MLVEIVSGEYKGRIARLMGIQGSTRSHGEVVEVHLYEETESTYRPEPNGAVMLPKSFIKMIGRL